MPTAQKAAMLQPVSKHFLEWFAGDAEEALQKSARIKFEELGQVVGNITSKVHERAEIDGMVMPWEYELDGEIIRLPDDFVMIRYEAFVVPKEAA
ncbi:hypothetical protein KIY82_gp65 [Mycobacterium phage Centaur]|uniref:Uncharacterized protein n=2 Tax=Turbidovirus TaxID=2948936 RepID=A0A649VEQ8_9CAUD|nr:hypothetical protein KIY81_gp51 [Mycobacterium phage Bugsy]YP_010063657.1 hypothetical protein KIY82_gp65 [Mycobacterium phage Centaur]AMB18531.1 hypothetical protein NASIATALIE_41 [Mycobacterium phage NaSiaTalie]AYD86316.1 hypothetical protein SEA_FLARE16_41 [Mycobacterium phage Flare16]AZF93426.1 hypothetical protein SEA_CENTAUR_42 [Mycobacterium phage Centaur]QGJ90565.1 hypothetical protein SEA_BUGSY_43 [Mycobacterium phage Bugsy]